MKKKLQKDFRWLKKWYLRLLASAILAILPAMIAGSLSSGYHSDEDAGLTWFICSIIFFIGLYFFTAWLYGDEETEQPK